jgi:hypothetical protein
MSSSLHTGTLQTSSWQQQQRLQLVHPKAQQQQMMRQRQIYDVITHDSSGPFGSRETLMPMPASLRQPAGFGVAAASSAHAARPPAAAAAAGVSVSAYNTELNLQAVPAKAAALAAAVPSSCLSPLHWHQANLGNSSAKFYSAMVSVSLICACAHILVSIDFLFLQVLTV